MADTITWPELIVLMGFGEDGGGIRGTFRVRDTTPLDDDFDVDDDDTWWDRVEQHPTLGRVAVSENDGGLLVRGDSYRVERPDGRPMVIETPDERWFVRDDDATRQDTHLSSVSIIAWPDDLIGRPQPSRWEGTDFTRLTGPIAAMQFLGRPAWSFELAPPDHKPYPLQMVVDAATGRVLSHRNDDFGSVTEWTSVEFGVDLPDELFRWDGPVVTDVQEDAAADYDAELTQGRDWLAARGIGDLELFAPVELLLHESSDDGSFYAGIEVSLDGVLTRRPATDEPWVTDEDGYAAEYRWRDGGWDWRLVLSRPLADEQLANVQAQLR